MIVSKTFLIDFDGTAVTHDFPEVGTDVPGSVDVLKKMVAAGHRLILHTCRYGKELDDAVKWFTDHGIPITYINCNPEQETGSRKVYSNYSIDDHNIGVPLFYDPFLHKKPFVHWLKVEQLLKEKGLL